MDFTVTLTPLDDSETPAELAERIWSALRDAGLDDEFARIVNVVAV